MSERDGVLMILKGPKYSDLHIFLQTIASLQYQSTENVARKRRAQGFELFMFAE